MIKVNDEKLLTAFYYGLRNTLVANNLEQASRIAYGQSQRHRVVTLKGEIIEVSGTMSGGGQPSKGRMGNKIAAEELTVEALKTMQDELANNETQLKQIVQRRQDLVPIIENLNQKLEEAKSQHSQSKHQMNSFKEQIIALQKNEKNIITRLKEIVPDEAAQTKLEKNLEKLTSVYDKAENLTSKVREENEALCKKILEISKNILDGPKEELKRIEKQTNDNNKQILSLNVEIKTSIRNLENAKKKLETMKEDIEHNKTTLETNTKRLGEIDENGKVVVEQYEEAKAECESMEKEINEMNKSIKQIESKKQKFEAEKIDFNHKLEKCKEDLKGYQGELKHYTNLRNSLKLHDIEGLERVELNDKEMSQNENETQNAKKGLELKVYDEDTLEDGEISEIKETIQALEEELKTLSPNISAIQSYNEMVRSYEKWLHLDFLKKS